jgi:acetoacetyl-CoA synthetase
LFPEIEDSICIGQRRKIDTDERVLLFVKMKPGQAWSMELAIRLRLAIRQRYSSRHVPQVIFEVAHIPYTANRKKCEINVKQIVSEQKVAVSGTVAYPHSLDLYREYANLPLDGDKHDAKTSKW